MDIKGKSALVTGGASGIGLACVKELLRNGAEHVAVCDCDAVKGEAVLTELTAEFGPGRAIFITTDVTKADEFEDAFKRCVSSFKTLDIVINNAGIIGNNANWERTIEVNFKGIVRGTLLALQYMGPDMGGKGGIVCNTASISSFQAVPVIPVYVATKSAIVGLSRSYGTPYYFQRTGVRVVTICPGKTTTSMVADEIRKIKEDWVSELRNSYPPQLPDNVATGVMEMIKTADNGSVWVSEGGEPVYEVLIPQLPTMRKKQTQ